MKWLGSCVVMLAVLVAVTGCEQQSAVPTPKKVTSEDVRRDASKAVETATDYSRQAVEEFQKRLDARIKELDVEISKLREKGRDVKDQVKPSWDRMMADLEKKRDAARAKLSEVGQSSEEAWKDVKKGAQSAWSELEKAFNEAARDFDR